MLLSTNSPEIAKYEPDLMSATSLIILTLSYASCLFIKTELPVAKYPSLMSFIA